MKRVVERLTNEYAQLRCVTIGGCIEPDTKVDGCENCELFNEAIVRLAAYEDSGLTPEQIKEIQQQIERGELVRVVRCGECERLDTVECFGSHKTDRGWFTPRCLGSCLGGERRKP